MVPDPRLLESLQRRGDVIGGDYVIGDVLGVGGMGVVYAATQRSLDRTVALKMPRPELACDPIVHRRFQIEVQAGSRVDHRNLVRVLASGEDRGIPYLVSEYVIGCALGELVLVNGPMPLALALRFASSILAGLEDAHARGIVHADVKCANVLVETLPDGTAMPRIIDFGIARFVDDRGTSCGEVVVSGTPEYLAPELVRGELPSFASDVYAVGAILYELVSGATPFAGGTTMEVMSRQLEDAPVPLSLRCPDRDISPALDDLVARALAKAPCDRFRDAAAFRRALDAEISQRAAAAPETLRDVAVPVFATEIPTAKVKSGGDRGRLADGSQPRAGAAIEQRRRAVVVAVAGGDSDAVAIAYLDLARAHVDRHDLAAAIAELERGVRVLTSTLEGTHTTPVWRLLLTLAALHGGNGDRARAVSITREARDHALRASSAVGVDRADRLFERLARRRGVTQRPPW